MQRRYRWSTGSIGFRYSIDLRGSGRRKAWGSETYESLFGGIHISKILPILVGAQHGRPFLYWLHCCELVVFLEDEHGMPKQDESLT